MMELDPPGNPGKLCNVIDQKTKICLDNWGLTFKSFVIYICSSIIIMKDLAKKEREETLEFSDGGLLLTLFGIIILIVKRERRKIRFC